MPTWNGEEVTVRQFIIEQMYVKLRDMEESVDVKLWNYVGRDNLDQIYASELPASGVEEGDEEIYEQLYPFVTKRLIVMINFRFAYAIGQDPYFKFNWYLGRLQKAFLPDKSLGGYAIDVLEEGNRPEIGDRKDPRPGGTLILSVLYRHKDDDPYISPFQE